MKNSKKIRIWFEEAVEDLYKTNFWLAAEITKLGYPQLIPVNSSLGTAAVSWDDNRRRIIFLFNEAFFETLTKEEFKYIVCHESTHVMNLHIFLFQDQIRKLKKKKTHVIDVENHMARLNIAADCVVNDSITNLYNLPRLKKVGWAVWISRGKQSLMELAAKIKMDPAILEDANPAILSMTEIVPKGQEIIVPTLAIYGMDMIEIDTEDMSVMDVFYLLPEDLSEYGVGNHDAWKSFLNEGGTLKRDFVDKIKDFIDGNLGNSALSDEEARVLEEMKETLEDSSDDYSRQAGKEAGGKIRSIHPTGNVFNWSRLLYRLTEVKKPKDVWNRSPRKLASVYPDVILPSIEDQEKEDIFVAVDTSSSIDRTSLSLFVDVVRSTPKRFRVTAINFDTRCYEWDFKNDDLIGRGGTNFQIIENYIRALKKYPKAIFVLTDGDGSNVAPKHPERWCWLLYRSCNTKYIGNMQNYKIKDLLK